MSKETRASVPRLLALVEIVRDPAQFNVTLPRIADETQFVVADVGSQIDLALAAELAGVDVDTVYTFNPGYNRWSTDPQGPHKLVLPVDVADQFEQALALVPAKELVRSTMTRTQSCKFAPPIQVDSMGRTVYPFVSAPAGDQQCTARRGMIQ